MILTLAVSTVYERREHALAVFQDLPQEVKDRVECIVICQNDLEKDDQLNVNGVQVYYQPCKGLSKSRNLAINNASGKYIWFLDDDVILNSTFINDFVNGAFYNYEVILGKIYCSDIERRYKRYQGERTKRLHMLRVSSIEIIVKKEFVVSKGIYFVEELGLGAKYPSGEENVFMLDCFDKGARIIEVDTYNIYHPCLEEKRMPAVLWAKPGYPQSKKQVARRLGGILGLAFSLRVCVRALLSGVPLNSILKFFKPL